MSDGGVQRLVGVRYDTPLREGGSLPAVVETDRAGPYVVKFRGAGQGAKALVAELLAAELGLTLDLPVPRRRSSRSRPDSARVNLIRRFRTSYAAASGRTLG